MVNLSHVRVSRGAGTLVRSIVENVTLSLVSLELEGCDAERQNFTGLAPVSIRRLSISRCHFNIHFILGPLAVEELEMYGPGLHGGYPHGIARGARSRYHDLASSPTGWVANDEIAYVPLAEPSFRVHYDSTLGPLGGSNIDATRTNVFYVINKVHDYAYKYGWTEATYNFQSDNLGKGGTGDRKRPCNDEHAGFEQQECHDATRDIRTIQILITLQRDGTDAFQVLIHIGEARTDMLHDVYIALVEALGLSPTVIDDTKDTSSGSVSSSTLFGSGCIIPRMSNLLHISVLPGR
ncbi:hypothetical protein EDD85DRAFT_948124 [Armillaria nabsnona]|nr:hypothetical protein EDD85DRAFT_948124 [Armillaria nabsnona]